MNSFWMARRMGSGGSLAFNADRQVTRDGIPNVVIGGQTVIETLENWFYPLVLPTAGLTVVGGLSRQMGNPDLSISLQYSAVKGDLPLSSIIVDDSDNIENGTGNTQNGTHPSTVVQDTNKSFGMTVEDSDGNQASASTYLNWFMANYWAALSTEPATLIGQLGWNNQESLGFSKMLASTKATNKNFDCTGGKYIYMLYPVSYGNPAVVKTGIYDFSAYTLADVQIQDAYGISRNYKLLYTGYQTGADININIVS